MSEHQAWINDWKVEDRESRGYRKVLGAEGQEIARGGPETIRQVLMHIPQHEYETIINRDICPDTAYNDHIPAISYDAFKPEGWPHKLIADSPVTDSPGGYSWAWTKHPWFAWVAPGNVLHGYTNWFWGKRMFRLVARSKSGDWSLYIRIGWFPWRFDFVPENRKQFSEQWK